MDVKSRFFIRRSETGNGTFNVHYDNDEFLILDEHTAALDPKTAELIMQLTDKIVKEKQLTTIMVTHNLRYAVEYGNRLVMMHNGHMILDKKGKEKEDMAIDDILTLFNEISIECGN